MNAGMFVGFKCVPCNTSSRVTLQFGVEDPVCGTCGNKMVPDTGAPSVVMNVYCPRCDKIVGMALSENCSDCGGPYQSRPG